MKFAQYINITQLSYEEKSIFFLGTDIPDDEFVILPAENPDYFVRYIINSYKQSNIPLIIIFSVMPLIIVIILLKIRRDVIIPLNKMSVIPQELAKGNLTDHTLQYKNKIFHKFLWGLDMLRKKLDEQKDINLKLEKDRKTLVASLSHDIKTPLSSIKTYSRAMKDGIYSTKSEIHDSLDVILEKTAEIELLSNQLLDSAINAIEEITVDTSGHYFNELFSALDKTIKNRISLLKIDYTIQPYNNNNILSVDMDRFIEVCDNIIENAVKYGDLGKLAIRFHNEENYLLITIENTGGKIPEMELKHIFTSFYRGSNIGSAEGHGLGLYIAKKIMRAMNGDIYAENVKDGVKIVLIIKQQ